MGCLRNGAAVGTLNGKSQGIKQQTSSRKDCGLLLCGHNQLRGFYLPTGFPVSVSGFNLHSHHCFSTKK